MSSQEYYEISPEISPEPLYIAVYSTVIMMSLWCHPRNMMKHLAAQGYRCTGCGMRQEPSQARHFRFCNYTGKYFCQKCHSNASSIVPAYVLHRWSFKKYVHPNYNICTFSTLLLRRLVEWVNLVCGSDPAGMPECHGCLNPAQGSSFFLGRKELSWVSLCFLCLDTRNSKLRFIPTWCDFNSYPQFKFLLTPLSSCHHVCVCVYCRYYVSNFAHDLLERIHYEPVFDLNNINPQIYTTVPLLAQARVSWHCTLAQLT